MTLTIDQRAFLIEATELLRKFNEGEETATETHYNLLHALNHLRSMSDTTYRAEFIRFTSLAA